MFNEITAAKQRAKKHGISVILSSEKSGLIYQIAPNGDMRVWNLDSKIENIVDTCVSKYEIVKY